MAKGKRCQTKLTTMSKVKCYSVRLESMISISEKCYKATAFDGSSALIPKSQVFGQDYDVQKSDAWWISEWILKQKELQYSSKKESWFEKELSHASNEGVEIERHIPEEKECVETEPIAELVKEKTSSEKIYEAVNNKTAKVLTEELAKGLKGKRIATLYFGYRGQNGTDEFIVGDVVEKDWNAGSEKRIKELLREDGSETYIRLHFMLGNDFFSCSDSDREVFFIEL